MYYIIMHNIYITYILITHIRSFSGLELYGRFWLSLRKPRHRIALCYLLEAVNVYERWGADAKVELLKLECEELAKHEQACPEVFKMFPKPQKVSFVV